jgi:hypothetical protein
MIIETAEICAAALLGAFTVVGLMIAYLALCAVCKAISQTLWDHTDGLPR